MEKEKDNNKSIKEENKARFIQRLMAFIIDVVTISFVASLISSPFIDSKSINKLNDQTTELIEKYTNQEIGEKVYFQEASSIAYQLARKNGISSFVILILEVLYFVVFQFYLGGQTIGKKILKIKVISTSDKSLTMNQVLFRSLMIDSILLDIIMFAFMIFLPKSIYFYSSFIFEVIQYIIIFICCIMMMGKSGLGLHDKISHTEVIKIVK